MSFRVMIGSSLMLFFLGTSVLASQNFQCTFPKEEGLCYAIKPRFYFNNETGECEQFTYGGCGGNSNRFRTEEECKATCSLCGLPKVQGRCRARFPSYFFNGESGQCEHFIYGGCGGNANRFSSREDCESACTICELPLVTGPCRAAFPRWGFDSQRGKCVRFTYGGCQGNANKFSSERECTKAVEQQC